MSPMKKVWAVTSGSYSDYDVLTTFTTEELARAFIAREITRNDEINQKPEPFYVWDELPGPDTTYWWATVLIRDGRVVEQSDGSLEWPGYMGPFAADQDQENSRAPSGGVRLTAIRLMRDAALQRVNEYIAEHTSPSTPSELPSESVSMPDLIVVDYPDGPRLEDRP